MADTLRIKRRVTGGAGAPASLANAELAYNEVSDILYYGKGNNAGLATSIIAIAGPGYSGGGTTIAVSDTPPASPVDSSLWFESDTGGLFLRFNDGTSSQWVSVGGPSITLPIAETDVTNLVTDLAARVLKAGDVMTGSLQIAVSSANALLDLRKPASGNYALIQGRTGANVRWEIDLGDSSPETGSNNAGSNFNIARFNDAGTYIDTPLSIVRSSGYARFTRSLTVGNATVPTDMDVDQIYGGHLHVADIAWNAYYIGGTWKRVSADVATIIGLTSGQMAVYSAPTGAAGSAITLQPTFVALNNGSARLYGQYLFLNGSTGAVNGAGGAFLYGDTANIVAHLPSTGNTSTFMVQNTNGVNVGGFSADGWVRSNSLRGVIMSDGTWTYIRSGDDGRIGIQIGNSSNSIWHMAPSHRFNNADGSVVLCNFASTFFDFFNTSNALSLRISTGAGTTGPPSIRSDGSSLVLNSAAGQIVYIGALDQSSMGFGIDIRAQGLSFPVTSWGTSNRFAFGWNTYVAGLAHIIVDNAGVVYAIANGSDRRMKDKIAPSTHDCLGTLLQIPVREFKWRKFVDPWQLAKARVEDDSALIRAGIVAQELHEIFPEGVIAGDDFSNRLGRIWQLEQNVLIATLVGAVQQLNAKIASLEQRLGEV